MSVHIYAPSGFYIGQVRLRGHRLWETVTPRLRSSEDALARAVRKMSRDHHRARVLFITHCGYHEPFVSMEAHR